VIIKPILRKQKLSKAPTKYSSTGQLIHDNETNLKQKAPQGNHQKDLDWSTAHDLPISTKAIRMILHLWVLLVQFKKEAIWKRLSKTDSPF
jgi:hypothetical protein